MMNRHCGSLISILEAIRERCFTMEARLGRSRAARVVKSVVQGDGVVQGILRSWVDGVVREFSRSDDVLCVVRILLEIFVAEVRAERGGDDYQGLRAFFLRWIHRCILRMGVGVGVVGKTVCG